MIYEAWTRLRLACAALRGRHLWAYAALLDNRPLAVNVTVLGSLVAGDEAILANVTAYTSNLRDGIVVGEGSRLENCLVRDAARHDVTLTSVNARK